MTLCLDVVEGLLKLARLVNDKRGTNGTHVGLAVHALLAIGAILQLNLVVRVAEEFKV